MEQVQTTGDEISFENFIDGNINGTHLTNLKHNRVAEKLISIQTNFTSEVSHIVSFKDYRIFIYFSNGQCLLQDLVNEKTLNRFQMPTKMEHFKHYDDNTVLFLNTEKYILQLLDVNTGKIISTNHPKVPSEINWQLAERKPRKIDDLISSGLTIYVLQDSKMIVVLEQKNIICSVNEYVLTTFNFQTPNHLHQIIIPDEKQKSLYITPLNQNDSVMLWGAHQSEDSFDIFVCNVFQGEKGFGVVKLDQKCAFDIVSAFPINEREVSFWVNQKQPCVILVDWQSGKVMRWIDLNIINPQDINESRGCILNDVFYLNQELQLALISVQTISEESFSVVNLVDNTLSFTKPISSELNITEKCFSPNGKYYIEFEKVHSESDDCSEPSKVYLTINYLIGMRASYLYLLEKKKIQDEYGQFAVHQIINMLTQNDQS